MTSAVDTILREQFGHEALRPLQAQIIERVMGGGDALVVMPTGSGKSLCYQLPALALPGPGITLVFSPLIALMEDQVSALRAKGIRAQYINSTLSRKERERRYVQVGDGAFDLVYATPERMKKEAFVEALARVEGGVKLLAVDEAHCITKWGHDLRPAYQQVGRFREQLGTPRTIALTATATQEVRADIRKTLGHSVESMPLFSESIDRPNLAIEVKEVWDDAEKVTDIKRIARGLEGTGIVYFALIKDLDRMAGELRRALPEREIVIYHGRLPPEVKKKIYDRFIAATPEDGLLLLATNAFGMGVDKPDIRFIVHAQVPGSVEAYYQEIGRAGRDGLPSRCVLLYCQDDLAIQREFTEWMNPPVRLMRETSQVLEASPHADFDVDEMILEVVGKRRSDRRMEYVVIELRDLGVIEPTGIEDRFRFVRPLEPHEIDETGVDEKKRRDLERLLQVVQLVRADDPKQYVLDYFAPYEDV
ncbi:MAG: RecQ family ATP-dependent DNA helicase [Planctomycetota bacterium]|nr:RecQ family ATP-dependent DNA helicase [Planctomycetota bacterium]